MKEITPENENHLKTEPKYFVVCIMWDRMRGIPRRFTNEVCRVDTDEELYELLPKLEDFVAYRCNGEKLCSEEVLRTAKDYKEKKQREEDEKQFEALKAKLNK